MSRDFSAILPANVLVVFRTRRCSGLPGDSVPSFYTKTVPIANSGWVGASLGITGFPGTKIVHDAALALWTVGAANPSNQTALDTLAAQIAKDFYNFASVAFDLVYNGVAAPDMNALLDECEWVYNAGDCYTRIRSAPYNGQPEELHHHDPANGTSCQDNLAATPPLVTSKTPCLELLTPGITSSGGTLSFPVSSLCLVGGRLTGSYVRAETASCGCVQDCDPGTTTFTLNVTGCFGFAAEGITVTITDSGGATVASGVTGADGTFTVGLTKVGTYHWAITPPTGFSPASGAFVVASCESSGSTAITLTVLPGYKCCGNTAAWPTTLYLSTSEGIVTLVWDGSATWVGSLTVSRTAWTGKFCSGPLPGVSNCYADCTSPPSEQDIVVVFRLQCNSLTVGWFVAGNWCCPGTGAGPAGNCTYITLGEGCDSGDSGVSGQSVWSGSPAFPFSISLPGVDNFGGDGSCSSPITGSGILST